MLYKIHEAYPHPAEIVFIYLKKKSVQEYKKYKNKISGA